MRYFDFILEEAVLLIEQSGTWPPAEACHIVPINELARRAAPQTIPFDEAKPRRRR